MGIFNKFKQATAAARLVEEQLYGHVAQELKRGIRREGLWAKALADSDGNDEKAKALYLKYRVQSIRDESEIESALAEQAKSGAHSSEQKPSQQVRPDGQKRTAHESVKRESVSEGSTIYICDSCKALNTKPGRCHRCNALLAS